MNKDFQCSRYTAFRRSIEGIRVSPDTQRGNSLGCVRAFFLENHKTHREAYHKGKHGQQEPADREGLLTQYRQIPGVHVVVE